MTELFQEHRFDLVDGCGVQPGVVEQNTLATFIAGLAVSAVDADQGIGVDDLQRDTQAVATEFGP